MQVEEGKKADFSSEIAESDADHMKLKVLVNVFRRQPLRWGRLPAGTAKL